MLAGVGASPRAGKLTNIAGIRAVGPHQAGGRVNGSVRDGHGAAGADMRCIAPACTCTC